jgi:hypothetical protein
MERVKEEAVLIPHSCGGTGIEHRILMSGWLAPWLIHELGTF